MSYIDIKRLTDQKLRVRNIAKEPSYGVFEIGEEYDAYYHAPNLFYHYAEFGVSFRDTEYPFSYDNFFKYFQVLTVGFESVRKIEISFIGIE